MGGDEVATASLENSFINPTVKMESMNQIEAGGGCGSKKACFLRKGNCNIVLSRWNDSAKRP